VSDYRTFTVRTAAGAEIRTAAFRGRNHLVVPVVALREGVFWASNAPEPELVLASELAIGPLGWNGRPVVLNHPDPETTNGSANSPLVLEQQAFGHVFNVFGADKIEETKMLAMEAWLDEELAAKVGYHAERVLTRAKAGEPIEVSVGVFMRREATSGVHNGKRYSAIWRNIVQDHLAMLAEGIQGACSNKDGCGVRAASNRIHVITAAGVEYFQEATVANENPNGGIEPISQQPRSLRERLAAQVSALFGGVNPRAAADGISMSDIWGALDRETRALEPGFLGVADVFPEDGYYVYACRPKDETILYRRKYEIDGTNVTIGKSKREVLYKGSYEPVTQAAAAAPEGTEQRAACGCGGSTPTTAAATTTEGAPNMDPTKKKERVDALLANKKLPFTDADRAFLEAKDEAGLTALEAHAKTLETPATQTAATTTTVTTPTTPVTTPTTPTLLTAEQYIAAAPRELQDVLTESMRVAKEHRDGMIALLKATGRCDLTDAQLAAYNTAGLEQLVKLAGAVPGQQQSSDNGVNPPAGTIVNFAGRGAPRVAHQPEVISEPPDMVADIRSAAQKK
jgi:hypothetical protein